MISLKNIGISDLSDQPWSWLVKS